jgi:Uma2 family endonuclease
MRAHSNIEDTQDMPMALQTRAWTLAEFDRLPDDGNKYELVDGALFVTPAPSPVHERLAVELHRLLAPYVHANGLGDVYTPRAAIRALGSEVEPDLMVRRTPDVIPETWLEMPVPTLVVEILSRTTRARDVEQKREWYLRIGVAEYWMVDRWSRCFHVVRHGHADEVVDQVLDWHPQGATTPLRIDVRAYFVATLGAA